ncbi:hypothetical protein BGZ74_011563 [Mortierella antarctica]|nr:hypothetical protein BGZ74_011563 [Mortierella antarctica]
MGSARSPHSSPLDPHSPYTQSAASKRKSSRSDYDDHSHNISHEYGYSHNNSDDDNESQRRHSASGSSKKKKKSKREKERHHDRHYDDSDSESQYGAQSSSTTNVLAPTQKLPPIKISLRLPALSSIVTSSSSPSSASHKESSRKKIRTVYDSEDDQLRRRHETRDYSDPEPEEPSSSSHKKKKKKHKHKHRHPNHDDGNDVDHGRRDSRREHPHHYQDTAGDYEEDYEQDEGAYEAGTRQPSASKLTLRLGKTDKDSHSKERRSSKKSHRNHPSEENHAFAPTPQSQNRSEMRSPPPPQRQSSPPSQPTPVHTHQRSLSQSSSRNLPLSPVEVKQDYQWSQPPTSAQSTEHMQVGQKRPFAVLQSQRSVSHDIDNEPEAEEEDLDDPLAGELDEPEDYDEDEDEEEDDDNDGEDQQSDDNDTRSPSTPSGSQFGSKTVGGQLGSKTVPRSMSVPPKARKPKTPKDAETREGSVTASSATTKGKRKGKAAKRLMSPKSSTPAVPKKKELSAVCHKLLDQFIKKDVYVLFTQPVDPKLVPDYATVIKNPMDLSTMRAKVERNFYPTIDEFLSDFQLVCDNARLYNAKDTLYWKQADKLWEWGSKAIERDRKTVMDKDEEMLQAVKDEETLDIVGMGDYSSNVQVNRGSIMNIDKSVDSPMSVPETGRPHTPQQYRKSKKIKHRRDGTIALSYATDGSIDRRSHPDPWSLVPAGPEFGAQPAMTPITRSNGDYSALYLDDYPYSSTTRSTYRPSQFQDFGPFALLETPQESASNSGLEQIPAYTGMIFGDAKGEALVKSLIRFMDPIMEGQSTSSEVALPGVLAVQEYVQKKVERLTRGASTIVDKVATVVREEKSGRPSGADTMVPISLWNQDFVKAKTDEKKQEKPEEMKGVVVKKESEGTTKTESEDQVEVKKEDEESVVIDQGAELDVVEESPAKTVENDIDMSSNEMPTSPAKEKEKMIDIRQVIQDIKVWPLIQRKRADYLAWRQLKIELDSLLPESQRIADRTQPPPSSTDNSDDNIKILWGVKWTGGDSEESKKWVREYLETNSAEMIQIVRILSDKARPVGSVPQTPTETTATAVASPASLSEEERTLVEMMTKSIRKRLAEMAQYVPLSEINPKNLPPPTAPILAQTVVPTPPAAAEPATIPSTAGSSAAPTPIAPATASALAPSSEPPVTTNSARAASIAPSEGSISSLSSPGSSP